VTVAPTVSNPPSRERLILLQGNGTRKKSTADQQKEKETRRHSNHSAADSIIRLVSVLNESTVAGEEEVHMDEVNVVFGHQQEEGEPVIDSGDELPTSQNTIPLPRIDPEVFGLSSQVTSFSVAGKHRKSTQKSTISTAGLGRGTDQKNAASHHVQPIIMTLWVVSILRISVEVIIVLN
jgi:hypothetical protein